MVVQWLEHSTCNHKVAGLTSGQLSVMVAAAHTAAVFHFSIIFARWHPMVPWAHQSQHPNHKLHLDRFSCFHRAHSHDQQTYMQTKYRYAQLAIAHICH